MLSEAVIIVAMKFILRLNVLEKYSEIQIDEQKFQLLKSSRVILSEALFLEEKYEILVSNYMELEKEIVTLMASEMVRATGGYDDFFDLILILNVRLVNLLTSVRLYTDTLASHLAACLPEISNIKDKVKNLFKTEYDNNFEYRFMEALRNHVQHRGAPVHKVSIGSQWTDIDKINGLSEYSIYISAQKEKLLSDNSFKKSVLNQMPDEVNLCAATRKYIESISFIHHQAREMIDCNVVKARRIFEDTINLYKTENEGKFIGLHAFACDDDRKIDEVPLFLDWDDVRKRLVIQNRQLINLSKRYVTRAC